MMVALVLVAAGAALMGTVIWMQRRTPPPAQIARFSITFDGRVVTAGRFASISPDGTKIVYATDRLYVRALSDSTPKPIPGTEVTNGFIDTPTFSPDGSSIAFWFGRDPTKGELRKIAIDGGPALTITSASYPFGIDWTTEGIVYAQAVPMPPQPSGIFRVSPNGGTPQQLVALKNGEVAIEPQMLPGQNAVLFTYTSSYQPNLGLALWDKARIVVQSLTTGQRVVAVDGGSAGRYVASGHLLYTVGGTVLAVPFDVKAKRATGPPVAVLEHVMRPFLASFAFGNGLFSVSDNGSLLYIAGESTARSPVSTSVLAVMNRNGDVTPLKLPPAPYQSPRASPDGKRIAYTTDDGTEAIVWTYDLSGGTSPLRITFAGRNRYPIWTPDGQRIAFQSTREGGDNGIFWQRADGSGTAERLTKSVDEVHVPQAFSPTGDVLLFSDTGGRSTLHVLTMADRKIAPWGGFEGQAGAQNSASFSPDGRWVAYSKGPAADHRVYIQPFAATGTYQIAVDASYPVWSRDARELELFYLSDVTDAILNTSQGPRLASVKVATQPAFTFTNPTSVELKRVSGRDTEERDYDPLPDGRFVIRANVSDRPAQPLANPPMQVVLNWFEELKQRVPTK
jgi:Tol biopolymer transport system component